MTCRLCDGTGYVRINSVGIGGSTPCLACKTGQPVAERLAKRQRGGKRPRKAIVSWKEKQHK